MVGRHRRVRYAAALLAAHRQLRHPRFYRTGMRRMRGERLSLYIENDHAICSSTSSSSRGQQQKCARRVEEHVARACPAKSALISCCESLSKMIFILQTRTQAMATRRLWYSHSARPHMDVWLALHQQPYSALRLHLHSIQLAARRFYLLLPRMAQSKGEIKRFVKFCTHLDYSSVQSQSQAAAGATRQCKCAQSETERQIRQGRHSGRAD